MNLSGGGNSYLFTTKKSEDFGSLIFAITANIHFLVEGWKSGYAKKQKALYRTFATKLVEAEMRCSPVMLMESIVLLLKSLKPAEMDDTIGSEKDREALVQSLQSHFDALPASDARTSCCCCCYAVMKRSEIERLVPAMHVEDANNSRRRGGWVKRQATGTGTATGRPRGRPPKNSLYVRQKEKKISSAAGEEEEASDALARVALPKIISSAARKEEEASCDAVARVVLSEMVDKVCQAEEKDDEDKLDNDDDEEQEEELSEYEKLRLEKIKRNQAKLQELNIIPLILARDGQAPAKRQRGERKEASSRKIPRTSSERTAKSQTDEIDDDSSAGAPLIDPITQPEHESLALPSFVMHPIFKTFFCLPCAKNYASKLKTYTFAASEKKQKRISKLKWMTHPRKLKLLTIYAMSVGGIPHLPQYPLPSFRKTPQ